MITAGDSTQSLPDDVEGLRALVLTLVAERDAAIGERDAVISERDALQEHDAGEHDGNGRAAALEGEGWADDAQQERRAEVNARLLAWLASL